MRDLRFISPFVLSCTLLVCSRFQWVGGKSRLARALGSASSITAAALGLHSSSMSHAAWYMAATVTASRQRNTCETILPTRRLSCQEPASRMQSRMRWTGAALPRGALEDLAEGADEARVGVRDDELHAANPRSRISLRKASHESCDSVSTTSTPRNPPAVRVAADGRDHGRGGDAAPAAALDVGGVEPDVGRRRAVEGPCAELLDVDVDVQARRDGAHLVLGEPRDAHLLDHPLYPSGARACDVYLGYGGAVHAPVALDHVVREEAANTELRDAQVSVPTQVARTRSR